MTLWGIQICTKENLAENICLVRQPDGAFLQVSDKNPRICPIAISAVLMYNKNSGISGFTLWAQKERREMAVFTKIVIMRVFEELLAFKQLDKITVKDITDKCGISRNTFLLSLSGYLPGFSGIYRLFP